MIPAATELIGSFTTAVRNKSFILLNPHTVSPVRVVVTATAFKLSSQRQKMMSERWQTDQKLLFQVEHYLTLRYFLHGGQVTACKWWWVIYFHTSCWSLSTACVMLSSPGCWYFCCMVTLRFCLSSSSSCETGEAFQQLLRVEKRSPNLLPLIKIPHGQDSFPPYNMPLYLCNPPITHYHLTPLPLPNEHSLNAFAHLLFSQCVTDKIHRVKTEFDKQDIKWKSLTGGSRLPGSRKGNTGARKRGEEREMWEGWKKTGPAHAQSSI